MRIESSVHPLLLPDAGQRSVLQLGFSPLPVQQWILSDADFPLFQQHKLAQGQQLQRVYAALPRSATAQSEFADYLARHLLTYHNDTFSKEQDTLTHTASGLSWSLPATDLWHASLWAQEDFCLLQEAQGHYVLTAASVCSPSNWKLEDKIGKTVDQIHAPVPEYASELSARVNRFLQHLKVNKPLQRFNWSLQAGNELLWRDDVESAAATSEVESSGDADSVYWRVERQSFLRLPQSGAIVFAIRIYLHSADRLRALVDFDSIKKQLIANLPAAQRHYKQLDQFS